MKKLLLALALLLMPIAPVSYADTKCIAGTRQEFLDKAMKSFEVYELNKTEFDKFLKYVNGKRAEMGGMPIEADQLYWSYLKSGETVDRIGVVLMKDGCVVFGMTQVFELADFLAFLVDAGVDLQNSSKLSGA